MIASFDKAVHQKDLGTMAECAQVMTQFERGDVALMQVGRTAAMLKSLNLMSCHSHMPGQSVRGQLYNQCGVSCTISCSSTDLCVPADICIRVMAPYRSKLDQLYCAASAVEIHQHKAAVH